MLPRLGLDACGVSLGLFCTSSLRMRGRYHSSTVAITAVIQHHWKPEGNRLGLTALCLIQLLKPSAQKHPRFPKALGTVIENHCLGGSILYKPAREWLLCSGSGPSCSALEQQISA